MMTERDVIAGYRKGSVTIVGAGILGVWQALELARAGFEVQLLERARVPFSDAASRYAGAMIAPYCEAEAAPAVVRDFGLAAARLWRAHFPDLVENGSLVVAGARDLSELRRFARMTTGHEAIDGARIADLEPDLADRFQSALFFPDEAHMATPEALETLLQLARSAGAQAIFDCTWDPDGARSADWVIDCRGMAARDVLPELRGVRGERLVIRSRDVRLNRAVRLLHPRHPLYVVPWPDGLFMVGATVIESEDASDMTVRSALELMGLAYALHPGFGEAEIVEMSAGIRPSFPDNVPRAIVDRHAQIVRVNGAYRHGFLLAPVLANVVRQILEGEALHAHPLVVMT